MMRIEIWTRVLAARRAVTAFASVAILVFAFLITGANLVQAFSAADIYRDTASSVVLIFGFSDSGAGSSGTGSIVSREGLVLTNNHVITDSDTGRQFPNLVVYFKPQPITGDNRKDLTTPYLVEVIAHDSDLDLALLRIKGAPSDLRPIEFADSDEVEIGESVAAIGHPAGGGLWTLTTGTISSKRRDSARDIFQTDTAINPGNSGGPLLDEYSRLVGVNTFVRRVNEEGLPLEGLNYSLRSSLALAWINQQGEARVRAVPRSSVSVVSLAPAEAARDPAPLASRRSNPLPLDSGAKEFKGADGETMYGVPNPTVDLHDALIQARMAYQALIERADESVDEMNRLLDDYDNF